MQHINSPYMKFRKSVRSEQKSQNKIDYPVPIMGVVKAQKEREKEKEKDVRRGSIHAIRLESPRWVLRFRSLG